MKRIIAWIDKKIAQAEETFKEQRQTCQTMRMPPMKRFFYEACLYQRDKKVSRLNRMKKVLSMFCWA